MKQAYLYDEQFKYIGPVFVEEDTLPEKATWVAPSDGLYEPIIFKKDQELWVGADSPIIPPEPPTTQEELEQMKKEITEVQLAITEIIDKLLKESV